MRLIPGVADHTSICIFRACQKPTKAMGTPKHIIGLIEERLKQAQRLYEEEFGSKQQKGRRG